MDPRIKVALVALNKLEALRKGGKLKGHFDDVRKILMPLSWIDDLDYLQKAVKPLETLDYNLRENPKDAPLVSWCISIFKGLWRRFERGKGKSILLGLDLALGEIESTSKLERGLTVCRVSSKLGSFTVVTNLSVKKGDRIPFCVLPPVEFQGVVSEAMFVSEPIGSLEELNWKEVEGKVRAVLGE